MQGVRSLTLLACLMAGLVQVPAGAEVDFARLAGAVPEERVAATLAYFGGLGSRVTGYPGADSAASYIEAAFRRTGLDRVTVHEYDVTVPVDRGGFLEVQSLGTRVPLYGLWPNLVRTSTLPEGGVTTRLIDGGNGDYPGLDGKEVQGAAVLLDFNSGDAWLNSAYLGAAAVVFVEPDSTVYLEGEKKFLTMPLDLPRFWVGKAEADSLRRRLTDGGGSLPVHLEYRMDWERRPARNILGVIPGSDPLLARDAIVLEAYYDAMSVVPALAPGAEQAASITALLELARYFREHPPTRTVVFLATSAHHLGLRGIDDFIQRYLRKEEPFIERMVVRRVVEAALDRGLIEREGMVYRVGREEYTGKEALVHGVAEGDSSLVPRVLEAAIGEGLVAADGGGLRLAGERFADRQAL
ncbi:MAG: M28 family peptidase, partial [Candidatus Latescibacterota bacterium]